MKKNILSQNPDIKTFIYEYNNTTKEYEFVRNDNIASSITSNGFYDFNLHTVGDVYYCSYLKKMIPLLIFILKNITSQQVHKEVEWMLSYLVRYYF